MGFIVEHFLLLLKKRKSKTKIHVYCLLKMVHVLLPSPIKNNNQALFTAIHLMSIAVSNPKEIHYSCL